MHTSMMAAVQIIHQMSVQVTLCRHAGNDAMILPYSCHSLLVSHKCSVSAAPIACLHDSGRCLPTERGIPITSGFTLLAGNDTQHVDFLLHFVATVYSRLPIVYAFKSRFAQMSGICVAATHRCCVGLVALEHLATLLSRCVMRVRCYTQVMLF